MIIYGVMWYSDNYVDTGLQALFSTREKAEAFLGALSNQYTIKEIDIDTASPLEAVLYGDINCTTGYVDVAVCQKQYYYQLDTVFEVWDNEPTSYSVEMYFSSLDKDAAKAKLLEIGKKAKELDLPQGTYSINTFEMVE